MKLSQTHLFTLFFCFLLSTQQFANAAGFFLTPSTSPKMFYERHSKNFEQHEMLVEIWTELAQDTKGKKFVDAPDEAIKRGSIPSLLNPFAFWENRTETLSKIFSGWMTYLRTIEDLEARDEFAEELVHWLTQYTDNAYEFELATLLDSDDVPDMDEGHAEELSEFDPNWIPVERDELDRINDALDRLESEMGELDPTLWKDVHRYLATFNLQDQYLWVKAQKDGHSLATSLKAIRTLHKDLFAPTPFLKDLWTVELDRIVDAFPLEMNILKTESSSALQIYLDYKERFKNPQKRSRSLQDIHADGFAPRDTRLKENGALAYKGQLEDLGKKVLVLAQPKFGRKILLRGTLLEASGNTIRIQNKNTPEGYVTLKHTAFTNQTGVWPEDLTVPPSIEAKLLYVFAHSPGRTQSIQEMLDELSVFSRGNPCGAIVSGDRFVSP